jgi:hypothetical protein
MPFISRLYLIVPIPKGPGAAAFFWALALMLAGTVLTGIAGVIFASAMSTPAKWGCFGLAAIPLLGCIPMFLSYCYVAIKDNLRRAAQIEIRKPPAR